MGSTSDTTVIRTVNDFLKPRNDVRMAVLAEFNHDPSAAHLMSYGTGGA
jgi:hypothetical protein